MQTAPMPSGRRRATARGATMLEVLVAVLILSFGILGMVGLHARAIQFSVDADDRNRAALFADDLGAQMRLSRTTTLTAGQIADWTARVEAALPNAAVAIANTPNTATITITWQNPGRTDTSRLETVVVLTDEEVT